MNTLAIGLGGIATLLGIYYSFLGISAIKYLRCADQVDKAVGWTLWWCLDIERYSEEGQKLCKKGQVAALTSIVLWFAVYVT
jgi:hypothetical protein